MTTDRDREEAERLFADARTAEALISSIAQALAARVQHFIDAGLADAEGKPRKVLGTLPKFNGMIVGHGAVLWEIYDHWRDGRGVGSCTVKYHSIPNQVGQGSFCDDEFSGKFLTRQEAEAALAAKERGQ